MTKDETIKLAKQAGFYHLPYSDDIGYGGMVCTDQLLEFANLVAQKERDKVLDEIVASGMMGEDSSVIKAIRGRE